MVVPCVSSAVPGVTVTLKLISIKLLPVLRMERRLDKSPPSAMDTLLVLNLNCMAATKINFK